MKIKQNLNILTKLIFVGLCVVTLTFTANAQRRTTKKPAPKPAVTTTAVGTTNAELKSGAEKISIQIKNVSKFIYLLGGIANTVEAIDADIRARKITRQDAIDQNAKRKQAVITSIQNLRAGLAALEIEFRTKPALKNYNLNIQGITDLAAAAEDQATSGQLTQSGKTLLGIIEKLSDALVAIP